jgi:hypothetical protein
MAEAVDEETNQIDPDRQKAAAAPPESGSPGRAAQRFLDWVLVQIMLTASANLEGSPLLAATGCWHAEVQDRR